MKFLRDSERIERLVHLIQMQWHGTPADYAQKLEISESTFYRIIATLRDLGAPIMYNQIDCCYLFTRPTEIKCGIEVLVTE